MKLQHEVYLSMGSNQGNRKGHLERAISDIHQHLATVVSVSSFYETSSWGYQGATFYNVVLKVHTHKTPKYLHKQLQKIEKQFGRIKISNTYEDRVLDIDMLSFDTLISDAAELTLPHPRMHLRDFVLVPLQEIAPQWMHPVLQKSCKECLEMVTEKTIQKKLDAPNTNALIWKPEPLNYLVVEGNIGAGKTTLATKISEDFNAKLVLERFADNPFLPKFYQDQNRYAFPLEMSFLADRYQQLMEDLSQLDLFKEFVVSDYHIMKSLIFAQVTLHEDELKLYKTLFDIIHREIPKPDLYVYLYQSTESLLQNIKKRGRSFEQQIAPEYLNQIHERYFQYFKTPHGFPIHVLDVSGMDFVKNQGDYLQILGEIRGLLTT